MSGSLQNLFSPERLNSKWNSSLEDKIQKKDYEALEEIDFYEPEKDLAGSWQKCQELLREDFVESSGFPELIDDINSQIIQIYEKGEKLNSEEKSRLLGDLSLLEKLAEVQLLDRHT